jgi:RNA polymerase II C-terminal domain phosphatase-like 1/2
MPPTFNQPVAQPDFSDPMQGSPAREEGEVPESELDPDTRRRLLILQHGQDTRDPTPPVPVPVPTVQPHGNWFPTDNHVI